MENIINYVIDYIKAQDLYTLISLGVLFALVFMIIIYKSTHQAKTTYSDEIEDIEDYDSNYSSEEYNTAPSPNQEIGIWFIIDSVAIATFTLITYVLFFEDIVNFITPILYFEDILLANSLLISGVVCVLGNIILYYMIIKPALFNTKAK